MILICHICNFSISDPLMLETLLNKLQNGAVVVRGQKRSRRDSMDNAEPQQVPDEASLMAMMGGGILDDGFEEEPNETQIVFD